MNSREITFHEQSEPSPEPLESGPATAAPVDAVPLDPEQQFQTHIVWLYSMGLSEQCTARYLGMSDAALRQAIEQDEEFRKRVGMAQLTTEVRQLQNLQAAGAKHWQAGAWLLERLHPQRYARRGATDIAPQQVAYLMGRMTDILMAHVPDADQRDKVQSQVAQVLEEVAWSWGTDAS